MANFHEEWARIAARQNDREPGFDEEPWRLSIRDFLRRTTVREYLARTEDYSSTPLLCRTVAGNASMLFCYHCLLKSIGINPRESSNLSSAE